MGLTGNLFEGDSFSESYLSLLKGIMQRGKEKSPRGEKVRYIQDALFRVNAPGDVLSTPSRPYPVKYLNNELRLYFSGTLSGDEFGEASKFWLKLKNPDGTINSNYGHLVFYRVISNAFEQGKTQWQWAKQQLIADRDTRQALMFISSPHVQFTGNRDFICTLNYCFSIEGDRLSLTVNRRSQDVILGLTFDYPWEFLLMEKMLSELKGVYPDLKMGSYTMFCNNVHVYGRNYELIEKMAAEAERGERESVPIRGIVDRQIMDGFVMNPGFGG